MSFHLHATKSPILGFSGASDSNRTAKAAMNSDSVIFHAVFFHLDAVWLMSVVQPCSLRTRSTSRAWRSSWCPAGAPPDYIMPLARATTSGDMRTDVSKEEQKKSRLIRCFVVYFVTDTPRMSACKLRLSYLRGLLNLAGDLAWLMSVLSGLKMVK